MWLITNFGFFSVVEKDADKGKNTLTIRTRVKADLEQLRSTYIQSLGPVETDAGSDYKYRARVSRLDLAAAASKMILDIDYSNFKSSVASAQGSSRAAVYHEVWHALAKLPQPAPPKSSAARPSSKKSLSLSFGGVVFDVEGRILLRKPKGEFDGYVWTFPKGRAAPEESPEDAAVREVSEETGCLAEPLAAIEGTYRGGTTENRYFLMRATFSTVDFSSDETQEVRWVSFDEAKGLIAQTRNLVGRDRDTAVLAAARKTYLALLDGSIRPHGKERRTAVQGDWQTLPMPDACVSGPLRRDFTDNEMGLIRMGSIPEEMEDKWFVYFAENRLFFHRSWTGFCIYVVDFAVESGRNTTGRVAINRETDQYSETDIAHDLCILHFLIDVLLLERPAEYPVKGGLAPGQAAIHQWSMIGRAGH